MSSLLLDALKGKNHSRPPVWLMRQAGRYMPRYQKIRKSATLWEMFHRPDIAAEVTMLPIEDFDVDAAILFSDILIALEPLGFRVLYPQEGGPQIEPNLSCLTELSSLQTRPSVECLSYVYESIKMIKPNLKVPLIGFSGGPFTVASYAIEKNRKMHDLIDTKRWLYQNPETFHIFLEKVSDVIIDHLRAQVKAGVNALQIFDSWAGVLPKQTFKEFSLKYLKKILSAIKDVPIIIFCRGSTLYAKELESIHPNAISLDWHLPVHEVRQSLGPNITLQGNLDPNLLKASPDVVTKQTKLMLRSMDKDPAFIANLGHGVLPKTPMDSVKAFVDTVKSYSPTC